MLTLLLPVALAVPQGGDLSTLHPGDALVYFEMPDVQAVYQAYQSSAYAQILGDPECQRAVEKLARLKEGELENPGHFVHRMINTASDGMWSQIQPSLADLATISFSVSLHGMTPEQIFEGVNKDNFFEHDELGDRIEQSLRAAMVVDFRHAETAQNAFGFIQALASVEPTTVELLDGTATQLLFPGAWMNEQNSGALLIGNRIAFVAGEEPVGYFERQISQSKNPTALQRFARGNQHFPTLNEEGAAYTHLYDFQSNLGEQIFPHLPYKEFFVPALDLISGALGSDFDMLLRGGHWRVSMRHKDGRGLFVTQGFQPDLNLGPFDRVFTQHEIPAESLDNVHQDSVLAAAMTLDKESFQALLAHLFAEVGEDPFAQLKVEYDFSPEEDILSHLGPAWVASLPVSSLGISNLPGLSVWMELEDHRGLMHGLNKLQAVVSGTSKGEVELKSQDYRDHTLFTLRSLSGNGGVSAMLKPTIVVFQDRVLLTPSSSHAKKEIRRISKSPEERILHPLVNHKTLPEGRVVEYSFADWGRMLARLYTGAKQFLPVIEASIPPDAVDEIPVDLKALPEAELFTQYFEPTFRHRQRVENGILITVRSSVGIEFAGITSAGLGFAWLGVTYRATEPVELEAVDRPTTQPADREF